MADYTITADDVTDSFDTALSEDQIDLLISAIDDADACLESNAVGDDNGRLLKVLAVRHLASLQANSGRGEVRSQTAPSGASQSFGGWETGSTPYLAALKQIDRYGCIVAVLDNGGAYLGAWLI